MINDSTNRNTRGISHTYGSIWSYTDGYNYIPNINNVTKTALFKNKITISTEEKTKTEKGGN